MTKLIFIEFRFWLVALIAVVFIPAVMAQEETNVDQIIPLEKVNSDFSKALKNVESSTDTVEVYFNYIKRLIDRGNYEKADSILKESEASFIALNDSSFLASLYKERAFMYKVQRRFPKALKDYLWLKGYYESQNDSNELVEIYSLMAEYYRAYRNYNLTKTHLDLAEKLIKANGTDLDHLAYWYGRKAAWHTEFTGNSDSTQYYAERSAELAKEAGDSYTEALALNELGVVLILQGKDLVTTLEILKESKNLLLKTERYRDYVDVQNNIASRISDVDSDESLNILEQIIPLEEENNWYSPLITSLRHVKFQYELRGNTAKSDEANHKIYQARIDELTSNNLIAVNDLALTYANQLTEKELMVQEQKTQLAEEKALNNRKAFVISAIIAFFLSVISIIVFKVNRKFRRKNELLEERKREIESTNHKLTKSLNQQKVLYKELNHRVKNNLTVLTGLIYLQEEEESDIHLKSSMAKLRNRIKSMAMAHESLYNTEASGKINFSEYLIELFEELKNALTQEKQVNTEIDCKDLNLQIKLAIPLAMIINELFTNSIKHGFKNIDKGLITVYGQLIDDKIILNYKDNGKGYNTSKKQKLGLHLVELLLEQVDASIEDISSGEGFNVKLTFPVTKED